MCLCLSVAVASQNISTAPMDARMCVYFSEVASSKPTIQRNAKHAQRKKEKATLRLWPHTDILVQLHKTKTEAPLFYIQRETSAKVSKRGKTQLNNKKRRGAKDTLKKKKERQHPTKNVNNNNNDNNKAKKADQ